MHNPHIHAALMQTHTDDLRRAVAIAPRARSARTRAHDPAHRQGLLRHFPISRAAATTLHPRTHT
jgi:hypothetical protein